MAENNQNSDAQTKRRTSVLARGTLYCGIATLVLAISIGLIAPIEAYVRGGLIPFTGGLYFGCLLIFCTTLILGASSFVLIPFKPNKRGNLITTVSGLLLVAVSYVCVPKFSILNTSPAARSARTVSRLAQAISQYSHEHDGQLPPIHTWCEALAGSDPNIMSRLAYQVETPTGLSDYALNENLDGARLADVPGDVVLLFEVAPGKNPAGDRQMIAADGHGGTGCIVLFADLHVEFVQAEDFNDLRWKP